MSHKQHHLFNSLIHIKVLYANDMLILLHSYKAVASGRFLKN